jgi:hypothetical protein
MYGDGGRTSVSILLRGLLIVAVVSGGLCVSEL